jgi:hypothetical protein
MLPRIDPCEHACPRWRRVGWYSRLQGPHNPPRNESSKCRKLSSSDQWGYNPPSSSINSNKDKLVGRAFPPVNTMFNCSLYEAMLVPFSAAQPFLCTYIPIDPPCNSSRVWANVFSRFFWAMSNPIVTKRRYSIKRITLAKAV